jgi:protein-S-isoprenylcysteine O-methyltransferase Ste14
MSERDFLDLVVLGWLGVAAITAPFLFFVTAPYGRHARSGWGPTVPARAGWVLMEAPSALGFAVWFALGDPGGANLVFLALWEVHYLYRSFVFPLLMRPGGRMPVSILASGVLFNAINAYINGRWLFTLSGGTPIAWLADPRFLIGFVLFVAGLAIHVHADGVLRNLRRPGETGYRIPNGGLYRWVSCPNYLGETLEWTGWALATWSLPGAAFAIWTAANLVPRARSHHRWYCETFPEYPARRKAFLPGVF